MPIATATAAALNVQPRQRRHVYEALAKVPDGRSVKELLEDVEMSEVDLRQSLRKLDEAGLVLRVGRLWTAVQLEVPDDPSPSTDDESPSTSED
jgi:DNA-binding transcriptional ArsR family regulator